MENRRFHRVKFAAPADLRHQGMTYRVRLENISMRGALVSSHECIMIPEDDHCNLTIRLEEEDVLISVTARVAHSFFSMVGVEFVALAADSEQRLFELLQRITDEPEKLKQEWQGLQAANSQDAGSGR